MKKVYLVNMYECDGKGVFKLDGKIMLDKIFTNKKLAEEYKRKMNDSHWEKYQKWWWGIQEKPIENRY